MWTRGGLRWAESAVNQRLHPNYRRHRPLSLSLSHSTFQPHTLHSSTRALVLSLHPPVSLSITLVWIPGSAPHRSNPLPFVRRSSQTTRTFNSAGHMTPWDAVAGGYGGGCG